MKRFLLLALLLPAVQDRSELIDPYERTKNGPPLKNIFHKAAPAWIFNKISEPRSHPSARMPELDLTEDEVRVIMAYLFSIRDAEFPRRSWPSYAGKTFDELTESEFDEMDASMRRGEGVWGNARCTICHQVRGPGGLVGGFVDLRVGAIDLMGAAAKLDRDWLYDWLTDPKRYFPETLMPRYRFTDAEKRDLIEFMLRGDPFGGDEEPAPEEPGRWEFLSDPALVAQGRDVITRARCVVCHDIEGIPDILPKRPLPPEPPKGTFEWLVWDARCLTCHAVEGRGGTYAPDLTTEGSRLHREWIADFLEKPDLVRPLSQQMPKFNLTAEEARVAAEAIAAERTSKRIPADFQPGDAAEGARLFEARGCRACHAIDANPGGAVGPDLRMAPKRLKPGYVFFHLLNPHSVNPHSVEPDYGFSEKEARDLATFLNP